MNGNLGIIANAIETVINNSHGETFRIRKVYFSYNVKNVTDAHLLKDRKSPASIKAVYDGLGFLLIPIKKTSSSPSPDSSDKNLEESVKLVSITVYYQSQRPTISLLMDLC